MKLYADLPARRDRQVLADVAVLVWLALCARAGTYTHRAVQRLGEPGAELGSAGEGLARSLDEASQRVSGAPVLGDQLAAPLTSAGAAARRVAAAGIAEQAAAGRLALVAGLAVTLVPILAVLLLWLPARVRWVRRATAALHTADRDLLALRALSTRSLPELQRVHPAPASAWRHGEPAAIEALADLELAALGLAAPASPGRSDGV